MSKFNLVKYLKSMARTILGMLGRNRKTLNKDKIIKNKVNLEWVDNGNLGDTLGPLIVKWLLDKKNIDINKTTKKTSLLMAVGSLVGVGYSDVVIWGSGIHLTDNVANIVLLRPFRKMDIRAVRGPVTGYICNSSGYDCPSVYGDPAILMPFIYNNTSVEKKFSVSVILHYKNKLLRDTYEGSEVHYIDIDTLDYVGFIDELLASEKVISSSLHGIILAETYGVPSLFLNSGDYVDRALMKYSDWYLSTDRYTFEICNSIEEAVKTEPMPLPNLEHLQKGLIESFPYDLWD